MPESPLTAVLHTPSARQVVPRRTAWLLPAGLLLGFALLFLLLFRDRLIPARGVDVAPALAVETVRDESPAAAGESTATGNGRLLFQASGWIEPDPLPVKATALTDGVVAEVHVLEGQLVKKGELLATLIDDDARLRRDELAHELEMKQSAFDAHCVGTQLAIREMDMEKAGLAADEADAEEAGARWLRFQRTTPNAIPEGDRINARLDVARSQAAVDARRAKIERIAQDMNRIAYETVAMQAGLRAAETKLAEAELALRRTRITAPADGRVLRLLAAPGMKKMLAMDEEDSSTIAILYDPANLQIRVDVPLADAAGLSVGQRAKIRCNLLPDRVFDGEVTRITGEADLQRNTLQAKVRLIDPDERLRPEMLSRVEFFDTQPASPAASAPSSGDLAVFVPEAAVRDGSIWVCDPESKRVSKRAVTLSTEKRGDHLRLDAGVRPGEWIVLDPAGLRENQRVNPSLRSSWP